MTCEGTSRKLNFAIWKTEHEFPENAHFESTQVAEGRTYQLKAWLLPAGKDYRLELTIESAPANGEHSEVSEALAATRKRIEAFLSESGAATLPPNSGRASAAAARAAKDEDENGVPDDIPFFSRVQEDVRQSRLNRRVF